MRIINGYQFVFNKKGFTLVELLVAIAVVGVLAVAILSLINPAAQLAKARDARRKSDLDQIKSVLEIYYSENGKFPVGINGEITGMDSATLARIPKDPLPTQEYSYESPVGGDSSAFRLYAKLERCQDSQGTLGVDCSNTLSYNYSINSPNISALAAIPAPTPVTFNYTGAIVTYQIPLTGNYTIEAWGAAGGNIMRNPSNNFFGRGADMKGTFYLTRGTVLKILVGRKGGNGNYASGGGGGTFVVDGNNKAYIVAGGGGGSAVYASGSDRLNYADASILSNGRAGASRYGATGGSGGSGGAGGSSGSGGSGGAGGGGVTQKGGDSTRLIPLSFGGASLIAGGAGGNSCNNNAGSGGYGGGGGGEACYYYGGGGGGGYSGGGGGSYYYSVGGGGGSYNGGVNQTNTAGTSTGDGKVVITKI